MAFSVWRLDRSPNEPWFRQRPVLVLAVSTALYLGVLVLRLSVGDAADAYSLLYVFPVALLALTFGWRGGLAAGAVAVALVLLWTILGDVSLSPTGWLSRAVPMLVLGVLLGDASDRVRRADAARQQLESAALLHREAIEINDSLVQGMTAAKWSLEAGRTEAGLQVLDETILHAQDLVSGLIRQADMGRRAEQLR